MKRKYFKTTLGSLYICDKDCKNYNKYEQSGLLEQRRKLAVISYAGPDMVLCLILMHCY